MSAQHPNAGWNIQHLYWFRVGMDKLKIKFTQKKERKQAQCTIKQRSNEYKFNGQFLLKFKCDFRRNFDSVKTWKIEMVSVKNGFGCKKN